MSLLSLLQIDPVELTGFAREVVTGRPHFLETVLPTKFTPDIDFEMSRGATTRGNAAKFRVYDTPAPIGKRPPVSKVRGSLPPLSQKISLGEEEILRLQNAISTGRIDPQLRQQVFNDVATEALAVADRMELARGEALYTGKIVIAENGIVGITVDFGRAAGHTVTAGTLWSNHASSTPITNLRTWTATYLAANGVKPGAWLTSSTALGHLLANAEASTLLVNLTGQTPGLLTEGQLQSVVAAHGIAPIVVADDLFMVDGASTRAIPANRIVALPPAGEISKLGASLWTTTAEALALAAGHKIQLAEAPGIVATIHETEDPVAIWTKAAGIGLPFLANPDLTFAATIA